MRSDCVPGAGTFSSDHPPALAALKEALTEQATGCRRQVSVLVDAPPETARHAVRRLWPALHEHRERRRRQRVSRALRELHLAPEDTAGLGQEHRLLLQAATTLGPPPGWSVGGKAQQQR